MVRLIESTLELILGAWLRATCSCKRAFSLCRSAGAMYGRCLRCSREILGVPFGDEKFDRVGRALSGRMQPLTPPCVLVLESGYEYEIEVNERIAGLGVRSLAASRHLSCTRAVGSARSNFALTRNCE